MKKIAYKEMYENEMTHGWYSGTRSLLSKTLSKYIDHIGKILDAGCGTGGTMIFLKRLGYQKITGIDKSKEAIYFCRKRGLRNIRSGSVNKLPFKNNTFDAIISLDVLYHQGVNLKKALGEYSRVLKRNGVLYVQEPAYDWLRSSHDEMIKTGHRFTISEIYNFTRLVGLKIKKCTHFNTTFFLPILFLRLFNNLSGAKTNASDVQKLNPLINTSLKIVLQIEAKLISLVNFPFGLSIVCVAKK